MTEIYIPEKSKKISKIKTFLFFGFFAVVILIILGGYFYKGFQEGNQPIGSGEKEEKPVGVWCSANGCYWFGNDGLAGDEAPKPEGNLIISVTDENYELNTGQTIIDKDLWKNIIIILDSWLVKDLGLNKFSLDREKQEFIASAKQFEVLFNLRFNPTVNLEALKEFKSKGTRFDLRSENKIYYQ